MAIEILATVAVQRVSVWLDSSKLRARPERRMTSRRLKRILDYFEARLAEQIHLADLASDIGLSESYLARTFQAATGTTLHAALMERRIARARLLIEDALRRGARANLADVAAATGFSSHAHMTTAFGRVLGVTPTEWMRIIVSRPPREPTDHSTAIGQPQGAHRCGGTPLEDDVGRLHKEGAQVLVAALGDLAELSAIAGRLLFRDETEPGGKVASLLEAAAGTDRWPPRRWR
jgi:AraC family transcriptional regulator